MVGFLALTDEVLAGTTTAVMLVPQAMAYALLAGLDPIIGLYASTLPLVVFALVGRCPQLAVGPTALDAMLVGSALAALGATGSAPDAAALAGLTGLLLVVASVLRLGAFTRWLTPTVLGGFTTAAAVLIATSQLPHLLGLSLKGPKSLSAVARALPHAQPAAVVLAAASIGGLLWMKRHRPRWPRFLLVLLGALAAMVGLGLEIPAVGDVPSGLPGFQLMDYSRWLEMLPWAAVLALVASMETLSIAAHFSPPDEQRPNQELLGIGLANLAASITGGLNVAAGFSRSAVHAEAGATRLLALVVTAGVVAVVLIGLTAPLASLPTAALAAIIVSSLPNFVKLDLARTSWQSNRVGFVGLVTTAAACVVLGIVPGLALGLCVEHGLGWSTRLVG